MQQSKAATHKNSKLLLIFAAVLSIASCTMMVLVGVLTSIPTYLSSSAIGCSPYLITKYQSGDRHLYVLTIIASCFSFSLAIGSLVTILYRQNFQDCSSLLKQIYLSKTKHIILYLCLSGGILMVVIIFGRFVDLIVDARDCIGTYRSQWVWICCFAALILLLMIIAWLINLQELRTKTEQDQRKNALDQVSFAMDSPFFDNLRNPNQHLKPFLGSERKARREGQNDAKSNVSKKLKKELRIIRQEGNRQKDYNQEEEHISSSSKSNYHYNDQKYNKPSTLQQNPQRIHLKVHPERQTRSEIKNKPRKEKPKTISFALETKPEDKDQFKEHDMAQSKLKMHIPTTNSKPRHLIRQDEQTQNKIEKKWRDQNRVEEQRKNSLQDSQERKGFGDKAGRERQKEPPSRFSPQKQTNHVLQRKKLLPHQNYSQQDLHPLPDDSNEWMFDLQNPYSKYLREEETKKEELEMIIFSHQAAKLSEEDAEKFIVFQKKKSAEKKRKKLFQEGVEEEGQPGREQALVIRRRNSSLQKQEGEILNSLRHHNLHQQ